MIVYCFWKYFQILRANTINDPQKRRFFRPKKFWVPAGEIYIFPEISCKFRANFGQKTPNFAPKKLRIFPTGIMWENVKMGGENLHSGKTRVFRVFRTVKSSKLGVFGAQISANSARAHFSCTHLEKLKKRTLEASGCTRSKNGYFWKNTPILWDSKCAGNFVYT